MPVRETESDERLILAYIDRGDRPALAALFERYQSQAYALARHSGLSPDEAEDAVQSAFVELLRSVRTFRRDGRFAPWFFRIVITAAQRKRGAEQQRRLRERPAAEEAMAQRNHAPDAQLSASNAEALAQLDRALAALPANLRMPVLLRYRFGLDGAQAAAAMDCPENTFRTWLKRGIDELRAAVLQQSGISRDNGEIMGMLALLPLEAAPKTLAATLSALSANLSAAGHSAHIFGKGMAFMKAHPLTIVALSIGFAIAAAICMPSFALRGPQAPLNTAPAPSIGGDKQTPPGKDTNLMDAKRRQTLLAAQFCKKLGTLISSGVPPMTAMKLIESECADATMKTAIQALTTGIEQGGTLGSGMAKLPELFPAHLAVICDKKLAALDVTLIAAGELTELDMRFAKSDDPEREQTRQVYFVTKCLGILVGNGFPIKSCLDAIAAGTPDAVSSIAVNAVSLDLSGGMKLSDAFAKQSKIFPAAIVTIVSAGETVGWLDLALRDADKLLEREVLMDVKPDAAYRQTLEVAAILYSLGAQLGRGKDLGSALDRCAKSSTNEPYHSVLLAGAVDARNGSALSAIFQAHPKMFGPSAFVIARAGEAGNVLGNVLLRLAWQYMDEACVNASRLDVDLPAIPLENRKTGEDKKSDF